jgi:DNA-nicking Smr family endonuclease
MKHGSGGTPGKGGRQMTPDEAELWQRLAHSLDKVKAKPRVPSHDGTDTGAPAAGETHRPTGGRRSPHVEPAVRRAVAASAPMPVRPSPPARPPPAEFDRRTMRQVSGGRTPIDATLDLHGLRQHAAHARLRSFLVSCQAKGHRIVLVVTGKGGGRSSDPGEGAESSRGILRRNVPLWLEERELRALVVGYAAAGPRHGGDGALYIRLRKVRDT